MLRRSVFSILLLGFAAGAAYGQTAGMLGFQGLIKDADGNPINGTVDLEFRIFDAETFGNLVDMDGDDVFEDPGDDVTIVLGVTVTDGILSTKFGPVHPKAFDGTRRWLQVSVDGSPMSRVEMVTAPATAEQVNQPASGTPGLRIEPNHSSPNLIGGFSGNSVAPGVEAGTIGGGGVAGFINRVLDLSGTVGGGDFNTAGSDDGDPISASNATVGGGGENTASGQGATVGGGFVNTASGGRATVSGGSNNIASGSDATVGGGNSNTASGDSATVPGGVSNSAGGSNSFAGGSSSRVRTGDEVDGPGGDLDGDEGTFVWSDTTTVFTSSGPNQFLIKATGGVGIGTNAPGEQLTVAGTVESTSGGFKFPDGTLQTTASTGTDTLGALACVNDEVAKWNGVAWACATDVDTDTLGELTCGSGQIARWDNNAVKWICATDMGISTLDEAYDGGGAGAGRIITADAGAVQINGFGGLMVTGTIQSGSSIIIDGTAGSEKITSSADLELHVSSGRALRIEADATSPNLIGGHAGNIVSPGVRGATIGGGGAPVNLNSVGANFGTVGGGLLNTASGLSSAVGGGVGNLASGTASTVGGGEFNTASALDATVGGGISNRASGTRATVGGGRNNVAGSLCDGGVNDGLRCNAAADCPAPGTCVAVTDATVGGGQNNAAAGTHATVGGGFSNKASAFDATVGGGQNNTASATEATVGGGGMNVASGLRATIAGGRDNFASGAHSTIPGGRNNFANHPDTFAAGVRAKAIHDGSFVWADSNLAASQRDDSFNYIATQDNDFSVLATGGVNFDVNNDGFVAIFDSGSALIRTSTTAFLSSGGMWTNASDAALKENFNSVDPREILDNLATMPISTWSYKAEDASIRHLGPTSQDFSKTFGLGHSDKAIGTVDADGVALAAIQGLHQIVREQEARIAALESALAQANSPDRVSAFGLVTPALAGVCFIGLLVMGRSRKGGAR